MVEVEDIMSYNYTIPMPSGQISNMTSWMIYMNTVTDGLFWVGLLITIYIITFFASSIGYRDFKKGWLTSSFFFTVLSILGFMIGIVDSWLWILGIILTGISVMVVWFGD